MGDRRDFLKMVAAGGLSLPLSKHLLSADPARPNVIFILADDLGYAELGCYGQKQIRTPDIDGLAREGMRFSRNTLPRRPRLSAESGAARDLRRYDQQTGPGRGQDHEPAP